MSFATVFVFTILFFAPASSVSPVCLLASDIVGNQDNSSQNQSVPGDLPENLLKSLDPTSDIKPDLLVLDYQQCFAGCEISGHSGDSCQALCACSIREIQQRYVLKSYIALRAQMSRNTIDESNKIILAAAAAKCTGEAIEKGYFTDLLHGRPPTDTPQTSNPEPIQ